MYLPNQQLAPKALPPVFQANGMLPGTVAEPLLSSEPHLNTSSHGYQESLINLRCATIDYRSDGRE